MPKRKTSSSRKKAAQPKTSGPMGRPLWSGTITFGLVSIPVDLVSAVRARPTALKLIDEEGHALGREYHCSKDGKQLTNDDLIRGYETKDGKMVVITDAEFESVAPEMSADINLVNFVAIEQIHAIYFQKPYYLLPSGKSSKAYNLLVATMANTGRVGIGNFVMRGHEYLVAIIADHGVLRADTLRYADEIRTPESIGLATPPKVAVAVVAKFAKEIGELKRSEISLKELEDTEADELQALVKEKQKRSKNVIHQAGLESEDEQAPSSGAQVIDLMAALRRSLSNRAVVTNAEPGALISLDERRARRAGSSGKSAAFKKKATTAKKQAKPRSKRSKSGAKRRSNA